MHRSRKLAGLVTAAVTAATLMSGTAVVAQDDATEAEPMGDMTVEVTGIEYAFAGLPESVPVGTTLTFTNDGVELHELIIVRIPHTTTESLDELLAMQAEGRDPRAEGLIEIMGEGPLFAEPGQTAEGSFTLDQPGDYAALCFVPQGMVPEELMALGVTEEMPEEEWPPEAQAIMANPPHLAAGMLQEFVVTANGEDVEAEA